MQAGKMTHYGPLSELLRPETRRTEIGLADGDETPREALEELTEDIEAVDDQWVLCVGDEGGARPASSA